MKTTYSGRVVYSRKKHFYDGFSIFRTVLGAFPSPFLYHKFPEEYFWLHAACLHLLNILGQDAFRKMVGTLPYLDPLELPYLQGEKKMTKKWQAYRVIRNHIVDRWGTQVVEDAKNFFLGILDLILEFEEPIELIKGLWALIK